MSPNNDNLSSEQLRKIFQTFIQKNQTKEKDNEVFTQPVIDAFFSLVEDFFAGTVDTSQLEGPLTELIKKSAGNKHGLKLWKKCMGAANLKLSKHQDRGKVPLPDLFDKNRKACETFIVNLAVEMKKEAIKSIEEAI